MAATPQHQPPAPDPDETAGWSGRVPYTFALLTLLILHLTLMIGALRSTSVTVDEFGHLPAGYAFLTTGQTGWLSMNPPLQPAWAALPLLLDPRVKLDVDLARDRLDFWDLGRVFLQHNRDQYHSIYMRARIMTALLSVITGLLVAWLARALAGPRAGLLALFLYALSPDFLAHGGLVTADQSAALSGVAVITALLFYRMRPSPLRLGLAGAAASLLILSKFSALLFLPLVPVLLLAPLPEKPSESVGWKKRLPRAAAELAVIAAIAWLITAAAYRFEGMFVPLRAFAFTSPALDRLHALLPGLPAPLPRSWLTAFDRQLAEHSGAWTTYLFGRATYHRVPYYYLVCMLSKAPLALLALLGLGLARLRPAAARRTLWSLGPGLWFFLLISLSPAKQIGARMALPGLAFLIGFAGTAAADTVKHWKNAPPLRRALTIGAAAGLLWYAADTVRAYPHYIAYFNELVGGPALPHRGDRVLADSNLDWGQDLIRLAQWQQNHHDPDLWLATSGLVDPAIYGVRYSLSDCRPRPGYNAVSVGLVLGLDEFMDRRECYANFRRLTPVDRVGASIWIYQIKSP